MEEEQRSLRKSRLKNENVKGPYSLGRKSNMVTEEIKPEDIMTEESWEEGWKEEDLEIDEIKECPKCASKLEIKQFDVDFLNGRITVHEFEKMYCPACGYVFMNSKQAQLYEDLLDHFIEVDKHYSLTVQKMPVQGVKAEV